MSDPRIDLPSIKAANFDQRIREVLMTYMGRQGNPLDRGLTLRDLIENGLASIRDGYNLRPGAGFIPLQPGPGLANDKPDLTPPPTPTGFEVGAAISHVFIEHDAPTYTQGHGHLRTWVYGATYTGGTLPTFADAVEITQFSGTVFAYPTNPATTWRLWIKWETRDGVLSENPAGGTNGLAATTGEDVAQLLEALSGQITEGQLYQDLNDRINLIDGPSTTPGTVAFQVAQEAAQRAYAVAQEAAQRAYAVAQEAAQRADAVAIETHQRLVGVQSAAEAALNAVIAANNERTDRIADVAIAKTELYTDIQQGLSAEAGERTLLAAQLRGGYTGNDLNAVSTGLLYQERIARATQDTALALQITLLAAGVGEQFDWADIWYFDTDAEGWGGNGAPTVVAGFLRPANQASGAYVTSPADLALDAAKYKQARLRIRKVGTPTFAGFLWWNAVGQSWDAARRVALAEPTYDANGIGVLTINTGWTGTIDQLRLDLSSAQTSANYFEIDWFAVGRPAPGASTAQVLEEQQARASAVEAEATSREALSTAILGRADASGATLGNLTQGLLFDERQSRATGDSALASSISTLNASVTILDGDVTTLSSNVTSLSQAVADVEQSAAAVSIELLSTGRKLDADAETVLRNTLAGQATRTQALSELAFAREDLSTRIETGLLAEASQRLLLAAQVNDNSAAITEESTARSTQFEALSTQISTVSATTSTKNRSYYQDAAPTAGLTSGDLWFDTNDGNRPYRWSGSTWIETTDLRLTDAQAAIVEEATARTTKDAALASQINTVSTTANAKNRTYRQTTAPTVGLVDGDVWFDTDDSNKAYRWTGTVWAETSDARIASNSAAITDINTARIGYCTLGGATSVHGTKSACEAAGGTWNVGLPWATAVKQVAVADPNGGTAALEQSFAAQKSLNDKFKLQYSVKLDANGYVSGFGLYSDSTGSSEFIVNANRFAVSTPVTSIPLRANNTVYAVGQVTRISGNNAVTLVCKVAGVSGAAAPVGLTIGAMVNDGAVRWQVASRVPFAVQAVPQQVDGVTLPAGVYIDAAYVLNSTIQNAQIANLAVDDTKIANLSVNKLTAGSIAVGQYIQSTGVHTDGTPTWRIDGNGTATFNNAVVRGTVYATNGQFWGILVGGAATSYSSGLGFYAGGGTTADGAAYRWRVGSPTGARIQWTGSAVEVYTPSNTLAFSSGGITAAQVSGLGTLATQNSVGYSAITGTKPPADADKTSLNTAAGIVNQGNFATLDQITTSNVSTYIANAAIGTAQIANAAIGTAQIANAAITQAKIGNLAVGSAQIADASITNAKIGTAAITSAKIGTAEIDTLRIAGNAVTVPAAAYSNTTATSLSLVIVCSGSPVIVWGMVVLQGSGNLSDMETSRTITVTRNGVTIQTYTADVSPQKLIGIPVAVVDNPGAGTHTYQISGSGTCTQRSLVVLEVKR